MLATSLIAFREGLEAALIVGIILGYLSRIGQTRHARAAWLGVLVAVVASVGLAFGINAAGAELGGWAEEIFEGVMMFLAVGVLTWMVFWMRSQARSFKSSLEREVRSAVTSGQAWALFGVTFVAVVREGVEMALFLIATALVTDGRGALAGALIGLGAAGLVGGLIYASTVRLNVRAFFNVTSVLLLLFAAGLLAHGVHEFQGAGLLPMTIEHVWDMNYILDESSTAGELMMALFGYNGDPSLLEVISYAAYWLLALVGVRWGVEWFGAKRGWRLEAKG